MTQVQYLEAKAMLKAYQEAADNWRKENKTNGIPPEVCIGFPFANKVTNGLRSSIEVCEFKIQKPKQYFLYIHEARKEATTYTGEKLGTVIFGKTWVSNFGDKRQHVTVFAINGLTYSGTYFKNRGTYARIKAKKQ